MKFNKDKKKGNFFKQTGDAIKELLKENGAGPKKIQKKMPLKMLVGMRKKDAEVTRREKEFNIESQILYNSYSNTNSKKTFVRDVKREQDLKKKGKSGSGKKQAGSKKNFEFKNGVLNVHKRMFK